jgi:hypothetical protein
MTNCFLLICLAGKLAAQTTLDVHVCNSALNSAEDVERSSKVLASILRLGGIELRWILEPPDSLEAAKVILVEPPRPGMERKAACAARRDIALWILPDSAAGHPRGVLGYSEPLAPAGINANVYYSRVVSLSAEYGIPVPVLLGHAMAHEIGHVLQRSHKHGRHGIMAGPWDDSRLRRIRTSGLFFMPQEVRRMAAAVKGEGCAPEVPSPASVPSSPGIDSRSAPH